MMIIGSSFEGFFTEIVDDTLLFDFFFKILFSVKIFGFFEES